MNKLPLRLLIFACVLVLVAVACLVLARPPRAIVLTGIVTTDEVIVSPQIEGRLQNVLVREGDTVTNGQLLAVIQPQSQQADVTFYSSAEQQSQSQVTQAEAELKFQTAQTSNQIAQAEASLASAKALASQAAADLEIARLTFQREAALHESGAESQQAYDQARTARDAASARQDSATQQVQVAGSAVALARSNAEQTAARQALLEASVHQLVAAGAQKKKADVELGHTEIRAPLPGVVDTRAALTGEVVNPGQAIVTLIDQDNLWVRADVEESYIDRVHLGDQMQVRLASGQTRAGTVFYRGVDADFATQRDVSRTKRDIRTFEIRLRCDNSDRGLAVGATAYVTLPLANHPVGSKP